MAISVACPSCDRELKVKDELVGRKVKCPGCGESIAVPSAQRADAVSERPQKKPRPVPDDAVSDAAPKKKRAAAEDDGDEERPRKKKKKQSSNLALWLGAGAGVLLLLACLVAGLIYFLLNQDKPVVQATASSPPPLKKEKEVEKEAPKQVEQPSLVGKVLRWKDKVSIYQDFRTIAQLHAAEQSPSGKINVENLKKSIERAAPAIWKEIQDGMYVLHPGTGTSDNEVVAYENVSEELCHGMRVVAFRSGRVEELTTPALEKALGKKLEPAKLNK